jgi:hypothetical protein
MASLFARAGEKDDAALVKRDLENRREGDSWLFRAEDLYGMTRLGRTETVVARGDICFPVADSAVGVERQIRAGAADAKQRDMRIQEYGPRDGAPLRHEPERFVQDCGRHGCRRSVDPKRR